MSLRGFFAMALFLCVSVVQADEPQWLKDARAREGKTMSKSEFKSKDKWLKATVPAKAVGTIEMSDDSYTVELDIGAPSPIYCEILPENIDMADMLRGTADLTLAQVEEAQGKIEVREIEKLDAGAYGNVPYLAATWVYTANAGKGPMAGGLKQISMIKNGVGIYCAHVDLGFTKTFQSVVVALANTLETAAPATTPYYHEIAAMTLGTMKCGIAVSTLTRDADGDTVARQMTAMLMPGAAKNAVSQDAVHTEFIDAEAQLFNAVHVVSSNGELTTNLALKPKDGEWIVEGDLQGKKVSVKLARDSEPGTWVAQALALRRILAAPNAVGAEHSIPLWTAADPAKLTDSKAKVLAKIDATHYHALGTAGPMTADMTLDATSGMVTTAELRIGPQKVKVERVYVNGAF